MVGGVEIFWVGENYVLIFLVELECVVGWFEIEVLGEFVVNVVGIVNVDEIFYVEME